MNRRIAAAALAALGIAAIPFLLAGSLPLPGLDAAVPGFGGGIEIFETISLVAAEIPAAAGQAEGGYA